MAEAAAGAVANGAEPSRRLTYAVLFVSVLAMSWAAPLIRVADAPPLAIAFWRMALSLPFVGLMLTVRGEWKVLRRVEKRHWVVGSIGGVFLAAHFASWIASVTLTSVAASVALVATQPGWVGLLAAVTLREVPRPRQWVGIGMAVAGAAVIGWGDWGGGRDPLLGDALALLGAFFVAAYYVIGRGLRREIHVWPYVAVVYGAATVSLGLMLVLSPDPVFGPWSTRDWMVFAALAVGPMIIGHTAQNWALGYLPAFAVNLTLLGEPVGSTLIAWALPAIREVPGPVTVAGGLLILAGIVIGLRRDSDG